MRREPECWTRSPTKTTHFCTKGPPVRDVSRIENESCVQSGRMPASLVRAERDLTPLTFMLLVALLVTLSGVIGAPDPHEPPELRFKRLSVNHGLSQSQVSAMLQDRHGYLWFGTHDGLNRYDGYGFAVLKHDPDDPNSLGHNHITTIYEDRSGVLWIGTVEGLNRYDPDTGEFRRYVHSMDDSASLSHNHVTAVYEEQSGVLWICTLNGLNRLKAGGDSFERFRYEPGDSGTISSNGVNTILEDQSGNLWIGTNVGLNLLDRETGRFSRVHTGRVDGEEAITALFEPQGEGGELWIGTWGGGFGLLDTEKGSYASFSDDAADWQDRRVTTIYEDRSGAVWIGTAEAGLGRLDRRTGTVMVLGHDPRNGSSLSDNRVTSVLEDRQGGLWVGALNGVNSVDQNSRTFAHIRREPDRKNTLSDNMVWSVAADTSGTVWIGTYSGGLNRLDRSTGDFEHYRHRSNQPGSLSSDGPMSLLIDRAGVLWVGTAEGLDRYDASTDSFIHYALTEKRSGGHYMNAIVTMYEDRRGVLWIGSRSGLFKFDRRKEEFQRLGKVEHRMQVGDPGSKRSEPAAISSLWEDVHGNLWIGSLNSGLYMLNEDRAALTHFAIGTALGGLSHRSVQAVYEHPDMPGVIWVGTYSGGLSRLEVETETFRYFTEQNSGLSTNTVIGILGGNDGNLWLGTHKGLVRLDPVQETFRTFDVDRGLQSREFNFGAAFRSADGELFFGGINGLNAFYPGRIVGDPSPPAVVLTDFKLFNTSVDIGRQSVLPRYIYGVNDVTLAHDQNDISFEYVGIHYAAPEQNQYAYMLENYDRDWRFVGDQRSAIYTSLDPGEYVFRVKSANGDGVWSQKEASVRVVIRSPWWSTGWAWFAYALLLVGGVVMFDRIQRRRLINRERSRAELREIQLKAQAAEAQALVLQAENDRQTRELEEARELQLSMLPDHLPDHPLLQIAAEMKTATEVGGDYYDYVVDEQGALTLVIGDATGHGANAGTMVTATKSLFNVLATEDDLLEVMQKSNRALKSMSLRKLYMALALVKFDNYRLELVGAGMPPALVYRAETGTVDEISLKGMPLGTFVDYPYDKQSTTLQPGDTVLLMTDGFPELFNGKGEMLGYRRARTLFQDVGDRSPQQILDHFLSAGSSWTNGAGRDDDMTFVVIKARQEVVVSAVV